MTAPGYGELARVFLRISLLGFGGPNAHLALMLDEVVERRRWISREHFLQLIGITNLLPGPNSSEVAIHLGYTQRGWRGALVSGFAFLAPTWVLVVTLSALYFRFGTLPSVQGPLWGLKPVIVAVILGAGWKLGRAAVTDRLLLGLAAGGVVVAAVWARWEVAAMAVGGAITWLRFRRPGRFSFGFVPAGAFALDARELGRLFGVTLWTGSVLFGGGYVLVALLQPYVVDGYGWLTARQFLDGIALTQAVPGPIVTLVAFVGYAVAGVPGAAVATIGIYLPSFAVVLGVAPHLERWRHREGVRAVLQGVNATVAGAILGVALALVPAAVPDPAAALLLAAALVAVVHFRVGAVPLILAGLAAGALRTVLIG